MSEKKAPNSYPQLPSAPKMDFTNLNYRNTGLPPSYEESQKNHQNNMPSQPSAPAYRPPPQYYASVSAGASPSHINPYSQTEYLLADHPSTGHLTQLPPLNQSQFNSVQTASYYTQYPKMTPVVEFDHGARFKGKGSGSLTIPPPPPGYGPTPAQVAAMQGQPVIVKKKKKTFF